MRKNIELILGTGIETEWFEIVNDYVDYATDLNQELNDKPMINIGMSNRDYSLMGKYRIDSTTHLCNLFRVKEYMKSLDFQKYELK